MIDLKDNLPYIFMSVERVACNNIFTVNEFQLKKYKIQTRLRNSLNITF